HTFNHKEHREHKETADQTQIGNLSAFFVISVVKNQATFGTAADLCPLPSALCPLLSALCSLLSAL
ncbi:MAG: hypothetical protein WAV60_05350, partial [Anaerolineae bacterium]